MSVTKGLAVIGRADPSGLGSMTIDYCAAMKPERVAIINYDSRGRTDPGLVPGCQVWEPGEATSSDRLVPFLEGMRAVVGFETFYGMEVLGVARGLGVKTICFPMWECSPHYVDRCDVLIGLSDQDLKIYPKAIRMSWPATEAQFAMKRRRNFPPVHFVHNAGHFGYNNRNATKEVIEAGTYLPLETDAMLTVRSFDRPPWKIEHQKIRYLGPAETREELYREADVIVFPMRFPGLSLPMVESAAAQIPTIVMEHPEWTDYPVAMKVPVVGHEMYRIGRQLVEYSNLNVGWLASMMASMARGETHPLPPTKPPTWAQFRKEWDAKVWGTI